MPVAEVEACTSSRLGHGRPLCRTLSLTMSLLLNVRSGVGS